MADIYLIGVMVTVLMFIDSHDNSIFEGLLILFIALLWPAALTIWAGMKVWPKVKKYVRKYG